MTGLNIPVPGEAGELQPFVMPHKAKFVGMMLAAEFRRTRARMAAVTHGTTTASGIPLSSMTITELSYYYNYLVDRAEKDEKSENLYEDFEIKRINAETLSFRLRNEELTIEEKNEILKELTDLVADIEKLSAEMEELGRD